MTRALSSEPDERAEHDREALLAIHEEERQAHYGLDAELLFRHAAETWTYVRDGRAEEVSRSELIERFRTSFGRAHYDEWEDIEPPRIEISEDGTLAVMVNRVGIRLTRTHDDGSTEELHGVYAGATVYKQNGLGWRSILNVSTFDPG
jgi:hypothetical protein